MNPANGCSSKHIIASICECFSVAFQLAELRQECDARGLETKGNKGDLVARLQAYLDEHGESLERQRAGVGLKVAAGGGGRFFSV